MNSQQQARKNFRSLSSHARNIDSYLTQKYKDKLSHALFYLISMKSKCLVQVLVTACSFHGVTSLQISSYCTYKLVCLDCKRRLKKGRNIRPDNWVVSSWRKRIQQDRKKHRTAEEFPHVQVIMHATSSLSGPPQLPLLLLCPLSRHLLQNLVAQWQDHCQPVHTHHHS